MAIAVDGEAGERIRDLVGAEAGRGCPVTIERAGTVGVADGASTLSIR
jgi:hypothetical protein